MLSLEDCMDFCDLTQEEVDAIAEHEHVPAIVAVELGSTLVQSPEGITKIEDMISDDIEKSEQHGDQQHAAELRAVLENFTHTHS